MSVRSALLIGSMPFEDEERCMRRAMDVLGPQLFSLPDGEVGDKTPQFPNGNRIAWAIYAIERLTADRANWQVVKDAVRGTDGMPVDYGSLQKLKPRRSPRTISDYVQFGYDAYFMQSYPLFKRLRREYHLDHLKFQMGVPTGFALGGAFASRIDLLRYTNAFNTVLAREVNRALKEAGDDVIIQIEMPPEVYAAYLLPSPLMSLALRPLYDLLRKITPGAHIGVHLCLGDFHNEAMLHPQTLHKLVDFSNRLVQHWPDRHQLAYVHYPFAAGAIAPTTDATYYQPLKNIQLPPGSRFVAGFVHEGLSLGDNARILNAIESARGQTVDIAASCGLGRRTPAVAAHVMELTARLTTLMS